MAGSIVDLIRQQALRKRMLGMMNPSDGVDDSLPLLPNQNQQQNQNPQPIQPDQLPDDQGIPFNTPMGPPLPVDYMSPEDNPDTVYNKIMAGYHPQSNISNQYEDMLSHPPQRNQRGMIGSIMSGLGGFMSHPLEADKAQATADSIRYHPYNIANLDYQQRLKDLATGAQEEQRENAESRQFTLGAATQDYNRARLRQQGIVEKRKADLQQQRIDQYAQQIRYKLDSGMQIREGRNAATGEYEYYIFHPNNPEKTMEKIDINLIGPARMEQIKHEFRSAEIGQRGALDLQKVGLQGDIQKQLRGIAQRKEYLLNDPDSGHTVISGPSGQTDLGKAYNLPAKPPTPDKEYNRETVQHMDPKTGDVTTVTKGKSGTVQAPPKYGQTKNYSNGKTGVWDGYGWVDASSPAGQRIFTETRQGKK